MDADARPGSRPEIEQWRASRFWTAVEEYFGERFAEGRWDDDRDLRVTVREAAAADTGAVAGLAVRSGVDPDRVHLETADPSHLAAWERLRRDLRQLEAEPDQGGLRQWPGTDPGYQRPPVSIRLAPYAEDVAADLRARYGPFVALTVGAFGYPLPVDARAVPRPSGELRDRVDPAEFDVALDGQLAIASGATLAHHVVVTNRGSAEARIATNGTITATVIDRSGEAVGRYVGAQILPLVHFAAPPGGTVRIPLVVGTASLQPALGYAVPPGAWHLVVPLDLDDGRLLTSAPLPFTVVSRAGAPR